MSYKINRGRVHGNVPESRICLREVAGSNAARGCCVYNANSACHPSGRGRLMSRPTSKSWGVNGHTTRCTSPVSVHSVVRLVSAWGLRATRNGDQRRPVGPCSGRTLAFNVGMIGRLELLFYCIVLYCIVCLYLYFCSLLVFFFKFLCTFYVRLHFKQEIF